MATAPTATRWCGSWRSEVVAHDQRIAWLLPNPGAGDSDAETRALLSLAAATGFRAVAVAAPPRGGVSTQAVEAEALRLGLRCIVVDPAAHCRLSGVPGAAQRRTMATALSRAGFDGLVLCDSGDGHSSPGALLATARALLRDIDQRDWESYH